MLLFTGTTDVSFIDPVGIGRNAFSVINDFVSGIAGYIHDMLCALLDVILDTVQGTVSTMIVTHYITYVCVSLQCSGEM